MTATTRESVGILHDCTSVKAGRHVTWWTNPHTVKLGCGCTRYEVRRCDGTALHALDGACALHGDDREAVSSS